MLARMDREGRKEDVAFILYMGIFIVSVIVSVFFFTQGDMVVGWLSLVLSVFIGIGTKISYVEHRIGTYKIECYGDYVSIVLGKYRKDMLYEDIDYMIYWDRKKGDGKRLEIGLESGKKLKFNMEIEDKEARELVRSTLRQKHGKPYENRVYRF